MDIYTDKGEAWSSKHVNLYSRCHLDLKYREILNRKSNEPERLIIAKQANQGCFTDNG